MGTKNKPGTFDCYTNAHPDEPMFILLGRDPFAAELVEEWAHRREAQRGPSAKVEEARACAAAMRAWLEIGGPTEVKIIVNGREHLVAPGQTLSYERVVALAEMGGAPSLVWRVRGGHASGTLTPATPGSPPAGLVPCEGLVFNVAHTGNA